MKSANLYIMKKIIILLSIFYFSFSFSQIDSIIVHYNVSIGEDKEILSNNSLKGIYEAAMNEAKNIDFILNANKKISYFEVSNAIYNDKTSLSFTGYLGTLFYENNSEFIYQNFDTNSLGKYIIKKQKNKLEWILTNENKLIDNFLFYKATSTEKIVNSSGSFNYPITAWYCPKIPLNTGPLGFNGLPGLILELSKRSVVYGVRKIELNPNKINIVFPIEKLIKTEDEVKKMKEDFLNDKN